MTPTHLSGPARREQIMDAAQALFLDKGYETATIEDVLAAVGIAKGTLYHHFRSKEAILESIVARTCEEITQRAAHTVEATAAAHLPAPQRLLAVLATTRADDEDIALSHQLQASGNMRFHLRSITQTYRHLQPLLTQVVADGVANGELHSTDPAGDVEVILAAGLTLLEGGIFDPADLVETAEATGTPTSKQEADHTATNGRAAYPTTGSVDSPGGSLDAVAVTARRQAALIRTAAALLGADPAALAAPAASPTLTRTSTPADGAATATPSAQPQAKSQAPAPDTPLRRPR